MRIFENRDKVDILNCAGVVEDAQASKTARSMRNLYLECSRQIVDAEDVAFHALMMPAMKGSHYIYTVDDADDLGIDAADFLGEQIGDRDCIVVMGSELLDNELSEDQMLEVVLADIALYVARSKAVADPTFGSKAIHVGWAATASTIAAAHDVIRYEGLRDIVADTIKDAATTGVLKSRSVAMKQGKVADNRQVIDVIERVCDLAMTTRGAYLPLPAKVQDIADCAKMVLLDAVDMKKAA